MMKIVEGFFACVFLINCAYVISYDSPGEFISLTLPFFLMQLAQYPDICTGV